MYQEHFSIFSLESPAGRYDALRVSGRVYSESSAVSVAQAAIDLYLVTGSSSNRRAGPLEKERVEPKGPVGRFDALREEKGMRPVKADEVRKTCLVDMNLLGGRIHLWCSETAPRLRRASHS